MFGACSNTALSCGAVDPEGVKGCSHGWNVLRSGPRKGSRAVATGGAFRAAERGTRGIRSLLLCSPQRGDGPLLPGPHPQLVTRIRARSASDGSSSQSLRLDPALALGALILAGEARIRARSASDGSSSQSLRLDPALALGALISAPVHGVARRGRTMRRIRGVRGPRMFSRDSRPLSPSTPLTFSSPLTLARALSRRPRHLTMPTGS